MAETVVKIDNLVKRYKELIALDHFDLEIKKGEVFGLLGPNGSGKTTTINCLLSLLAYDKGDIEIFGEKMSPVNYGVKKRIGVIMQNVAVFDELTVYENIDYFCGLYITDKATRKKYVDDAIAFVGLEDFVKFHPKKLSGGLLRRLNIACGIASAGFVGDAWIDALAGDPVSAFGVILITNTTVNKEVAEEINKIFFEVIIAPAYDADALEVLKQKKNRIILVRKECKTCPMQFRSLLNGVLIQEKDLSIQGEADL